MLPTPLDGALLRTFPYPPTFEQSTVMPPLVLFSDEVLIILCIHCSRTTLAVYSQSFNHVHVMGATEGEVGVRVSFYIPGRKVIRRKGST